jgi:hypothetical protein
MNLEGFDPVAFGDMHRAKLQEIRERTNLADLRARSAFQAKRQALCSRIIAVISRLTDARVVLTERLRHIDEVAHRTSEDIAIIVANRFHCQQRGGLMLVDVDTAVHLSQLATSWMDSASSHIGASLVRVTGTMETATHIGEMLSEVNDMNGQISSAIFSFQEQLMDPQEVVDEKAIAELEDTLKAANQLEDAAVERYRQVEALNKESKKLVERIGEKQLSATRPP